MADARREAAAALARLAECGGALRRGIYRGSRKKP